VTVLPKLQYCRVMRRLWELPPVRDSVGATERVNKPPPPPPQPPMPVDVNDQAEGPEPIDPSGSEYEAVLIHFWSFRVPWDFERLTGSGGLARGEQVLPAPTFCLPAVGDTHTPFIYKSGVQVSIYVMELCSRNPAFLLVSYQSNC